MLHPPLVVLKNRTKSKHGAIYHGNKVVPSVRARKLHKYAGIEGFRYIGLVELKLDERKHGRG
jgi:hypothetical protein